VEYKWTSEIPTLLALAFTDMVHAFSVSESMELTDMCSSGRQRRYTLLGLTASTQNGTHFVSFFRVSGHRQLRAGVYKYDGLIEFQVTCKLPANTVWFGASWAEAKQHVGFPGWDTIQLVFYLDVDQLSPYWDTPPANVPGCIAKSIVRHLGALTTQSFDTTPYSSPWEFVTRFYLPNSSSLRDCGGAGHCVFHCVAFYLFGSYDLSYVVLLRQVVCDRLRSDQAITELLKMEFYQVQAMSLSDFKVMFREPQETYSDAVNRMESTNMYASMDAIRLMAMVFSFDTDVIGAHQLGTEPVSKFEPGVARLGARAVETRTTVSVLEVRCSTSKVVPVKCGRVSFIPPQRSTPLLKLTILGAGAGAHCRLVVDSPVGTTSMHTRPTMAEVNHPRWNVQQP
jgi:hypothetical protein